VDRQDSHASATLMTAMQEMSQEGRRGAGGAGKLKHEEQKRLAVKGVVQKTSALLSGSFYFFVKSSGEVWRD